MMLSHSRTCQKGDERSRCSRSVKFFHDDVTTHRVSRTVHRHGETDVLQDAFLRKTGLMQVAQNMRDLRKTILGYSRSSHGDFCIRIVPLCSFIFLGICCKHQLCSVSFHLFIVFEASAGGYDPNHRNTQQMEALDLISRYWVNCFKGTHTFG